MYRIYPTKTYKIEYADAIGCVNIDDFIYFLHELIGKADTDEEEIKGCNGIYISENEEEIEIPFSVLEQLKNDPQWGKTIEKIIENSDKSNDFVHLSIC